MTQRKFPDAGKKIYIKLTEVEGSEDLYRLTHRQTTALLGLADTLQWKTRYRTIDPNFDYEGFAEETTTRLLMAIDFCLEVANCIDTSDDVKSAIDRYLRSDAGQDAINNANKPGLTEEDREENLALDPETCDYDILYGNCVAFIQNMNRYTDDFFQEIELATNNQEAISKIIAAVPVLETLPLDELVALADTFREFFVETYHASYTVELENQMICDIFCLAKEDCVLTLQLVINYFFEKITAFDDYDLQDILEITTAAVRVVSGWQAVNAEPVVYAMFMTQLGLASSIGKAFGFTPQLLKLFTQLGIANDDWMILCDECTTIVAEVWRIDYYEAQIIRVVGTWSYGGGGVYAFASSDTLLRKQIVLEQSVIAIPFILDGITVHRTYQKGTFNPAFNAEVLRISGTDIHTKSSDDMVYEVNPSENYIPVGVPVSQFRYSLHTDRLPLGGVTSGQAAVSAVDFHFPGERPDWIVGKGYPTNAFCSISVCSASDADTILQSQLPSQPSKSGVWVSGVGFETSVVDVKTPTYNQFPSHIVVHFPFGKSVRMFGIDITQSSAVGVKQSGHTANVYQWTFLHQGQVVWDSGVLNLPGTVQNFAHIVAYNDLLVDTFVWYAVGGNTSVRANTLANPGYVRLHSVRFRHYDEPNVAWYGGC